MFACCGRGCTWYALNETVAVVGSAPVIHNVESGCFRKHFPITPIFGFFGDGEIGLNQFENMKDREACNEPSLKKKKGNQRIHHQYSTIILLLSYL